MEVEVYIIYIPRNFCSGIRHRHDVPLFQESWAPKALFVVLVALRLLDFLLIFGGLCFNIPTECGRFWRVWKGPGWRFQVGGRSSGKAPDKVAERFWKLLEKVVYIRTYPCWKIRWWKWSYVLCHLPKEPRRCKSGRCGSAQDSSWCIHLHKVLMQSFWFLVKSAWFVLFFSFVAFLAVRFAWRTWDLVQLNESIEGWVSDGD